jgi:uncharacterized protein Yka (UPF0111/DUF47 family)
MLHWFRRILPRQLMFFPLFEGHAAVVLEAAKALRAMLASNGQLTSLCEEIIAREHEADEIARDVLLGLRTTFITPFDRADIQSLITSMDNSVDQIQQTAKAIVLFEMNVFDDEMRSMAEAIVECAELAQQAIGRECPPPSGPLSANSEHEWAHSIISVRGITMRHALRSKPSPPARS